MKLILTLDVKDDDGPPPLVAKVAKALISHALELLQERDETDYDKTAFSMIGKQETPWADINWTAELDNK